MGLGSSIGAGTGSCLTFSINELMSFPNLSSENSSSSEGLVGKIRNSLVVAHSEIIEQIFVSRNSDSSSCEA